MTRCRAWRNRSSMFWTTRARSPLLWIGPILGGTNGENAAHASMFLGNEHVDVSLGRVAVRKPGAHEATIPNVSKFRATKPRIEDAEKPRARTCRRSHETNRLREFAPLTESMVMSGRIGILLRSMVAAFLMCAGMGSVAHAEKRVALVIGNSACRAVPALPNINNLRHRAGLGWLNLCLEADDLSSRPMDEDQYSDTYTVGNKLYPVHAGAGCYLRSCGHGP
jgi:hypothetical protein